MKKVLITLGLALSQMSAFADEVPGLIIEKEDGTNVSVNITSLQNIKFADGKMIITQKDNSTQSIDLDNITIMTFGSISTAVKAITGNVNDQDIVVTDLSGKVIYKGKSNNFNTSNALKGIYIITVNGESHKVLIK